MKWLAIIAVIIVLCCLAGWINFATRWSAYQDAHADPDKQDIEP
jgi:hypothetical protein